MKLSEKIEGYEVKNRAKSDQHLVDGSFRSNRVRYLKNELVFIDVLAIIGPARYGINSYSEKNLELLILNRQIQSASRKFITCQQS